MSRNLSPAMSSAKDSKNLIPFNLVEFHFDSGAQYYTNYMSDLSWSGNLYTRGNITGIPVIDESYDLKIPSITIALSGVNQVNVSTALLENSLDRKVLIYLGLIDSSFDIVIDPVEIFKGRITGWNYKQNGTAADLSWDVSSHFADFERISGRRTNSEDQRLFFHGDKGLEFSARSDSIIKWGRS